MSDKYQHRQRKISYSIEIQTIEQPLCPQHKNIHPEQGSEALE